MDERTEIREFLVSRRARVTPDQVGLPTHGARRVPGLRREEVALLAGVSPDYYARLERGGISGASEQVMTAIARALLLDDAERAHLFDLASSGAGPVRRRPRAQNKPDPRPEVLAIIAGLTVPAYVRTERMDIVAANPPCRALYDGPLDALPLNLARFIFLDARAQGLFVAWEQVADDTVSSLRIQAGRDPHDPALSNLIGELSTRSEEFVTRWARRNVATHLRSRKVLRNRHVGEIELTGTALDLPADGMALIVYTAESDSVAEDQLRLLSVVAATREQTALREPVPSHPSPNRK